MAVALRKRYYNPAYYIARGGSSSPSAAAALGTLTAAASGKRTTNGTATAALGPLTATATSAASGVISSVTVGADGWYADIGIQNLGTGGSYAFGLGSNNDPATGSPKIVFTVTSLGFDLTGAATTVTRTIYGTKAVRQPYPNASLNQETVAGGVVTVRVALSNYLFAKDNTGAGNSGTAPTVTIASGFYTQAGTPNTAATNMAVTNNSTRPYPKVVGNWSWPGYDKVGTSFTARAVAFHSSAAAGRPVQCVKFTATDQHTNTVSSTVTDPTVDNSVGDAQPVVEYTASLATSSLAQGDLVTVNFIAYPRVGDTAACLDTSSGTAQPTPLYGPISVVCDKTGAYATSAAVVDPVAGNDATGAVTAAFNANTPPPAYLTMAAAFDALSTYNNTNYGRNNCGGSVMYLKDGTHPWVNGSPTLGSTPDAWLTITKFPTSTRGNVIIGTFVTGHSLGLKVKLLDVLITGQSTLGNIFAGAGSLLWIDRCEINCPTANQPPFYTNTVWHVTRSLVTSLNQGFRPFSTVNAAPGIIRGNTVVTAGTAGIAYTFLGNNMPAASQINDSYSGQTIPAPTNTIVAYNKLSGSMGSAAPVALRMNTVSDTHGAAFVQNLMEITTSSASPALQIAADSSTGTPVNNVLVWNNVVVGQRTNLAYNEVDTASGGGLAYRLGWSVKGNIFDDANIKSDTFAGSGFAADTAKVGNWSFLYGCGCSGNVYAETVGIGAPGTFLWEMPGLRCYQPPITAGTQPPTGSTNVYGYLQFVDPRSYTGTASGSGGGDYHLQKTSPAAGMQRDLVMPLDFNASPRQTTDAAGVFTLAVVGALTAPLGGLTTAGAGTRSTFASSSATLGRLTGASAGIRILHASGVTAPLGVVLGQSTGQRIAISGPVAAALGQLFNAASGKRITFGFETAALGLLLAAASGHPPIKTPGQMRPVSRA